jgi:hypothetical protein
MAVFKYSFEPWVDDHGVAHELALVGRDAGSDAAIVALHHDWESDLHLYGYWAGGMFAKVFVSEVRRSKDPDPMWEVVFGPFRFEPARPVGPSAEEIESHVGRIVDGLSQWPEADISLAVPGAVVRRIVVKEWF